MWLRDAREFGQISTELSTEESVDHLLATAHSEGRHLVFLRVGQKNGFSMISLGEKHRMYRFLPASVEGCFQRKGEEAQCWLSE